MGNYTQDVDADPGLDKILMHACTPMIKRFCDELLDREETEPGEVMECLIKLVYLNDILIMVTSYIRSM